MALRGATRVTHFLSLKTSHHFYLITNSIHTENNSLNPQNPKTESKPDTQFPNTHNLSVNRNEIINKLITVFTKKFQNSEELRAYGDRLTTDIVETVLKSFKNWKFAYDFFLWAKAQDRYKHNCYTYNTMASILSVSRQNGVLKTLVFDMINSKCSMSPGALGFLIRCLGNQGLVDEALYIFDEAQKVGLTVGNSYSYNCLLEVLAKSNKVELVEMKLEEMRNLGLGSDKFTLTPVLLAYCNSRRFEEALSVFNQMRDNGWVDEHVLTILVVSVSKWGEIDKAFELIEKMEMLNIRLNEKTVCLLVHGFVKQSRIDKAVQLFDKMRKSGCILDLKLYSVLIDGLCKKKELNKALDLYVEMKSTGILADVVIVKNLISAYCVEGDFVTSAKLVEESVQEFELDAGVLLFNALLEGLANRGMVNKAYSLIQFMMGVECEGEADADSMFKITKKVVPSADSFRIVIDCLCRNQKLDLALRLFADMGHLGYQGNLLIYNNLISELCNLDRLEEGIDLLKKMKESGLKPTHFTHNCIFGCLCRREDVSAALVLVREMRAFSHQPWIKHSSMLVKKLCKNGKSVEACNFLNGMVQEGFLPDIVAYSAAIDGLFKLREVDKAMELFQDISSRGYQPDLVAYNIILSGLCKFGKVLEAEEFLNNMLMKGLLPSVVTYNIMIDGFCKINEIGQALIFLKRMIDGTIEPTIVTYTTLIDGLCSTGKHDEALVLWEEMEKKGCIPNRIAYMALISGLCKCNKADIGLDYFHEMEEKEMKPDVFVYVSLINGFASNGEFLSVFEILKEMLQKETFPGKSDKYYPILIEAVQKLSEDASTSSEIKNLIIKGCFQISILFLEVVIQ
ncbi:putative pentatricopeptide repeat-containing protein At5g08310, mitochondrial [Papaver somniferum]|uniref:putative pentatricopeptide repeat-containing protein At5g08310, mitochondrial n=1 Tax=Papaver somniferum TaxID=3469 RepID=UPI000E6F8380|nr:putative pentatricopeptide repeat-containing protein At5g08310, mitochondrial [Papaver somniferum]